MPKTGRPPLELSGLKVHYLQVLYRSGTSPSSGAALWLCLCTACNSKKEIEATQLVHGKAQSCGCLRGVLITRRKTKHGHNRTGARSTEYTIWSQMKNRCTNPQALAYKDYGGRGISVHPGWVTNFEAFLHDVGYRPSPEHSLDRFPDMNGNYEPGNVRWATRVEQANNSRRNRWITFRGETLTIGDWNKRAGLSHGSIARRLDLGWSIEEALTRPPRERATKARS